MAGEQPCQHRWEAFTGVDRCALCGVRRPVQPADPLIPYAPDYPLPPVLPETKLRALAEAATPGPWHHDPHALWGSVWSAPNGGGFSIAACSGQREQSRENAALIAYAASTARVRALAGCAARLRARITEGHQEECPATWKCGSCDHDCECGHEQDRKALAALDALEVNDG